MFNCHDNVFIVLDFAAVVAAIRILSWAVTALAANYIADPLNLWLERNMLPSTGSNVVHRHLE
jgi:hypothetical protein